MQRTTRLVLTTLCVLALTGCFEIEQTIDLQKNMSGTADLKIGIDFEPMIVIMAQMKKEMAGDKSVVTKEELAAARAEFIKSKKSQETTKTDPEAEKKAMEKELPEGVRILSADVKDNDLSIVTTVRFAFDKINQLVGVKMPQKEGGDPTNKSIVDQPFESLQFVDEGKTFTIRSKPQNPAKEVEKEASQSAPPDPETEKLMKDAFKNLRVAFKISSPFEVVKHNATRREGKTLIWEYNLESLEKLGKTADPKDLEMFVTYKK